MQPQSRDPFRTQPQSLFRPFPDPSPSPSPCKDPSVQTLSRPQPQSQSLQRSFSSDPFQIPAPVSFQIKALRSRAHISEATAKRVEVDYWLSSVILEETTRPGNEASLRQAAADSSRKAPCAQFKVNSQKYIICTTSFYSYSQNFWAAEVSSSTVVRLKMSDSNSESQSQAEAIDSIPRKKIKRASKWQDEWKRYNMCVSRRGSLLYLWNWFFSC